VRFPFPRSIVGYLSCCLPFFSRSDRVSVPRDPPSAPWDGDFLGWWSDFYSPASLSSVCLVIFDAVSPVRSFFPPVMLYGFAACGHKCPSCRPRNFQVTLSPLSLVFFDVLLPSLDRCASHRSFFFPAVYSLDQQNGECFSLRQAFVPARAVFPRAPYL